jgi:formylglycine-generating enzyme required for sulfatase activity
VRTWLDELRSRSDVGDLGTIVAGWPQQSCTQAGATPAAPALAPAEVPSVAGAITPTETITATELGAATEPVTGAEAATETITATAAAAETPPAAGPAPEGMVAVAGGSYLVGSAVAADEYHVPVQPVELAPFWIDATEVTNSQYAAYLEATGAAPPATWPAGQVPAGEEQHPVRGLAWDDAGAYCGWAGKRLPFEAEWEAAARGQTGTAAAYPWGDDPGAGGQTGGLPLTSTYPAGSADFNRSPAGAYDMVGNVWEWVGDPYAPVAENMHILHGGRFGLLRDIAYRQPSEADNPRFVEYAGVRCAADQ